MECEESSFITLMRVRALREDNKSFVYKESSMKYLSFMGEVISINHCKVKSYFLYDYPHYLYQLMLSRKICLL